MAPLLFAGAFLKPGDFPLSSNLSRAAARAILAERQSAYERREVIICNRSESPHATQWHFDVKEHKAGRVISIPQGVTLDTGLRALGGFSEKELAGAAESYPEPLQLGTMLMILR